MKPPVLHINPQQIIYYERGNIKNKKNSNNKEDQNPNARNLFVST